VSSTRSLSRNDFHTQERCIGHIDQPQTSHNDMKAMDRILGPLGTRYHTPDWLAPEFQTHQHLR
jgi:hypothetical protein